MNRTQCPIKPRRRWRTEREQTMERGDVITVRASGRYRDAHIVRAKPTARYALCTWRLASGVIATGMREPEAYEPNACNAAKYSPKEAPSLADADAGAELARVNRAAHKAWREMLRAQREARL